MEEEWPSHRVRKAFLDFFESKSHTRWPSSPVVPVNDPTLLFTNAGMNQFKPIFLGAADPDLPLGQLRRACNSQKCIRAGGKHNDLDDVGKDTYHHTFFEMLGSWSFGDDYFKEEAIGYAWELLTKVYKLPADRFYATYFGGDDMAGIPADTESRDVWLRYLPKERVLPVGCKDNFWEMGETGPCGPCTEIHFDRIGNRDAASLVNNDDPNCIEIWNIVFIQSNRKSDGTLIRLPAQHVDTGMGFERLTSILQNKMSNYDTDLFVPLFKAIHEHVGDTIEPYSGNLGSMDVGKVDTAYRVVADHIRTLCFAIADGCLPGNEGREYVLRRILRRAVHFGRQKLMAKEGFLSKLVDDFVQIMGEVFPELKDNEKKIKDVIQDEEKSFGKTLIKGFQRFKKAADAVRENGGAVLSGHDAFVLWDTYGYPIDLTEVMAGDFGMAVDLESFNTSMEEAKQKARNARNKAGGKSIVLDANATTHLRNQGLASTNDSLKFHHEEHSSVVMAIYTGSKFVASTSGDENFGLVLKSTSFYAEQGGQIYDTGSIEVSSGSFTVTDVQVFAGYVLHIGSFVEGSKALSVGDEVRCKVDYTRRSMIAPNHTCTHMLNFALRELLGDHIDQKGSIVLPEKLRFDFCHGKPVKLEDLEKIELKVNQQIKDELVVSAQEIKLVDAKRINGLRAVSAELYPDPVRVVSIGRKVDDVLADPESREILSISTELCGGTHVSNTRDVVAFSIISEEGIAKGVRRITAVTAGSASQAMKLASSMEADVVEASKLDGVALEKKIGSIKSRLDAAAIPATRKADLRRKVSELEDQLRKAKKKMGQENIQKAIKTAVDAAEAAVSAREAFCVTHVDVGLDATAVREAVVKCMNRMPIMLFSTCQASAKVIVYAGIPPQAPRSLSVVDWLTPSIRQLNGRGGGGKNGLAPFSKKKNGLAQGQGNDASQLKMAMEVATQIGRRLFEAL